MTKRELTVAPGFLKARAIPFDCAARSHERKTAGHTTRVPEVVVRTLEVPSVEAREASRAAIGTGGPRHVRVRALCIRCREFNNCTCAARNLRQFRAIAA